MRSGMLKAAATIARQDWTRSRRDLIALYIMLSPLLLALAARFLLPLVAAPSLEVAVGEGVPAELSARLASAGHRVVATGESALEIRAGREGLELLAGEGGERAIGAIRAALEGGGRGVRPELADLVAAFLLISACFLAALGSGLTMVEDRSSGAIRALGSGPVGLGAYLSGKLLFIAAISVAVCLGAALVLEGARAPFGKLFLASLASAPLGLAVALLLGTGADSQLKALGSIKLIMPLYLSVPLAAVLVPEGARAWFSLFPNVWMLELFRTAFSGGDGTRFALALAATSLLGSLALVPLARVARGKLGFRS
ncbi:MAG: ABC transporter permease [Spirochaetales bacterium]|nr:ABC transporter permease [Spirochaetales bacterium]